jgi:hypothetical protein
MKKILVGAAVGTAGLVALTGATFAQTEGETPAGGVRDRVAEILGIAPEELQDAVQQARGEHREEQIAERLANAVENGVITQEEADSISTWLDAKPEVLDGVGIGGKSGNGGLGHLIGAADSEEKIAALIDRLIEAEKITEDDAVVIKAWLADAPTEALSKLGQGEPGDRGHRRGFSGRMFGEGPGGRLFEGRFQIRPYVPPVDVEETEGTSTATSVLTSDVI